ncbi:integrase/recombinase xerD homolog [Montipora capricornis]|uniref:integrase/recombinase xerD homolog n=1 Tax=Montipora capricornis TaxID=246305 RepID=UPI0035F18C61
MAGIPSPTDNPIVEAVRSASKRILGTAILNSKEPISSSVTHDIISSSNLENSVELRNITLYVLSFAGFFRFDDVSRIRRNDIFFNEVFMVIKVPKSKNDQLRRGDKVIISVLPSPACPVKLLKKYLPKFKIPPDSRDLIFRPISKGKDSCKLIAPDKPISYSTMRQAFRRDLKTIGADPSKFELHSLRSGGATMAANSGVSDRVFQRHGRWKSTKAKDIYVDDDLDQRLSVSKFLGL